MSLTKKQIQSVIADPSTFYLYKDNNVTTQDMIQIVTGIIKKSGPAFLLPIIKVAKDLPTDLLNDEVKTAIFTNTPEKSFYRIADIFIMYKIPVSAELINTLIRSNYDKYPIKSDVLARKFQPKLEQSTIEHVLKYCAMDSRQIVINCATNQLVGAKQYKFITAQKKLFDFLSSSNSALATQIAKQLIMDHEFAHINEQENKHGTYIYPYILFTDELRDLMINECLATRNPSAIVTNKPTLHYIFNVTYADEKTNAKFAKFKQDIVRQLLDRKEYDVLTNNSKLLRYIIQEDTTGALSQIPASWYFNAIKNVDSGDALGLMNKMKLPNVDLEYAYINRFNDANIKFPEITKLSPETIQYMRIIRDEMPASLYRGISSRVISALINCHFNDRGDWYKVMENLLAANPHLDVQYIKQMLDCDANVEILIKRYWKGDLNQIRKEAAAKGFKAKHKIFAHLLGKRKQNNI